MPLDPSIRNRYVTIQHRPSADVADTSGAPTEDWTELGKTFMAKYDLRGQEKFRANQPVATLDTRWLLDYRADMDPDRLDVPRLRRLICEGFVHEIVGATLLSLREGIELMTQRNMSEVVT